MRNFFRNFIRNESGATAIEYGLVAALIAVGVITISGNLRGTFDLAALR